MGVVVCVQDTERIRIEKSEELVRLTLRKVMRKDDGEYSCRLVNAAGETTAFTNLFVRQPVESVPCTAVSFLRVLLLPCHAAVFIFIAFIVLFGLELILKKILID